jgi:large subunit ribosomal protein L29
MKASELRQMKVEEVRGKIEDLEEELFNLRFQHVSGQLTSPIRLRHVRREIARAQTVLREHQLEIRKLPGGDK